MRKAALYAPPQTADKPVDFSAGFVFVVLALGGGLEKVVGGSTRKGSWSSSPGWFGPLGDGHYDLLDVLGGGEKTLPPDLDQSPEAGIWQVSAQSPDRSWRHLEEEEPAWRILHSFGQHRFREAECEPRPLSGTGRRHPDGGHSLGLTRKRAALSAARLWLLIAAASIFPLACAA